MLKNFRKGFTLLELLVVVLIIGILASIALPQYRLAKDKAVFAKCQSMVSSLSQAYREYLLIHNNNGTNKFENLSFVISSEFMESHKGYTYNCISNNDMHCCISRASGGASAQIYCLDKNQLFGYNERILDTNSNLINIKECLSKYGTKRAKRLCEAIGKTKSETRTLMSTFGTPISYDRYKVK